MSFPRDSSCKSPASRSRIWTQNGRSCSFNRKRKTQAALWHVTLWEPARTNTNTASASPRREEKRSSWQHVSAWDQSKTWKAKHLHRSKLNAFCCSGSAVRRETDTSCQNKGQRSQRCRGLTKPFIFQLQKRQETVLQTWCFLEECLRGALTQRLV